MSRSVDLFVETELPLDELAGRIGRLAGTEISPDAGGQAWRLAKGPVVAFLAEHRYVDDGDLRLSRYRYALSSSVAADGRPEATAEAAMFREIAQQLRQETSWPVLLVLDLQYRDPSSPARGDDATAREHGAGGPGASPVEPEGLA